MSDLQFEKLGDTDFMSSPGIGWYWAKAAKEARWCSVCGMLFQAES